MNEIRNNRGLREKSKRLASVMLVTVMLFTMLTPISVSAADSVSVSAKGAVVIDADTGKVLWGKNQNTKMVPASLTKLMTAFIVLEAIDDGQYTMDSIVPISESVATFSNNSNYSNVPLSVDGTYTVRELMNAMLISSACAASVALAEFTAGTHWQFVKLMNSTASELNLDATYKDAYGGSSSNSMTPLAVAQLGRALVTYHPEILEITGSKSYTFHGKTYNSTNRLVKEATPLSDPAAAVDGMKTGTTSAAGVCLCSTATLEGKRVVAVAMGEANTTNLYNDSRAALNYGLARAAVFDTSDMVGNFIDVDGSKWYADAVQKMLDTDLMVGISKYCFLPDGTLTRAQVAQILYNYAGNPVCEFNGRYSDVKETDWYADAVSWCITNGMIVDNGTDTLNPNGSIERQEMITMLYRYMLYVGVIEENEDEEVLTMFDDIGQIHDYAVFAVAWAVSEGLIQGMGDGKLSPASYTTRAQMAQLLTRMPEPVNS